MALLDGLLKRIVTAGTLTVIDANGDRQTYVATAARAKVRHHYDLSNDF